MRETRWRVKRLSIPISDNGSVWHVWGIWPPLWDIEMGPMLYFTYWRQAFGAAAARADFADSPEPNQLNMISQLSEGSN